MKYVALIAFFVVVAFLMSRGSSDRISSEDAHALVSEGALLLDVRTPGEFASGHVDGAINIPVQQLANRLSELPKSKDAPVVLYCRSGNRSGTAARILTDAGWTSVHDLGAMSRW